MCGTPDDSGDELVWIVGESDDDGEDTDKRGNEEFWNEHDAYVYGLKWAEMLGVEFVNDGII
jgi:hypothetical protein